jgi:hypothetical protein
MFRRWTPECTIAIIAILILGGATLINKDAMATGALIAVCQQSVSKMFEILKIRLGQKEGAPDAAEKM